MTEASASVGLLLATTLQAVVLLPSGWDASPLQGYPSFKFAGTHLYSSVMRALYDSKVSFQEQNTVSPGQGIDCLIRAPA